VAAVQAVLVDLGTVVDGSIQLTTVHAEEAPPPGKGEEFGKASPVGLVVILLLAVATVFLIRSMSKRIRRLPASFDPPEEQSASDHGDSARPSDPHGPPVNRDAEDAGGSRA
jgi:hypothetical protein